DGSEGGTALITELRPGAEGSVPTFLTAADGALFMIADDGEHGRELWRSDGTADGTVLTLDINPGPFDGATGELTASPFGLLFAADDGQSGIEPWRSSAAAGTAQLANVAPDDTISSSFPSGFVILGGSALFSADDGENGRELWVSDGTPANTH